MLTERDLRNVRRAKEYGVTGLLQPFVRSGEDLTELRRLLQENGGEELKIFAKIESREGVEELESILPHADVIVIAAPYWDMMFPAVLKTYLENVTVSGITFCYSEQGTPKSLCRAKALYYVTTAGGFIGQNDFGFSYVKALAQSFFGIPHIHRYAAEGLDIFGADPEMIMSRAKRELTSAGKSAESGRE
jgi:FMN-dependent NADH-azoreductase